LFKTLFSRNKFSKIYWEELLQKIAANHVIQQREHYVAHPVGTGIGFVGASFSMNGRGSVKKKIVACTQGSKTIGNLIDCLQQACRLPLHF
jgi:hypothetical protein